MNPKPRGDWKPPRDRREVLTAVLASAAVVIVVAVLLWVVRPNQDSGTSTPTVSTVAPTTTVPAGETTTLVPATTLAPTTTSTP